MSAKEKEILTGTPTNMYINGAWVGSENNETISVINPVTEEELVRVPAATKTDVDTAVRAAHAQFEIGAWSKMTGADRRNILFKLADLLEQNADKMAAVESLNNGRMIGELKMVDIPHAVETFRYYAGWADKIEGRTIPTSGYFGRPTLSYTIREPVGVIGAITPWNVPLMIAGWKLAPALATGCTIVMKVSEESPLSTLFLAKLAEEAGLPPGVFNVITGTGDVAGASLVDHPLVRKISFTGSPEVGRIIQVSAAKTFKRVTLELGGKSPQIVLDDANLENAVRGCAAGLFTNQGQICAAGTRILVHRSKVEEFTKALAGVAKDIVVGDPAVASSTMGALISKRQLDTVEKYVGIGVMDGGKVVAGGKRAQRPGYFFEPTVFADINNDMRIAREEIFGPVGVVIPFDSVDNAIQIANDSIYGLAATIWTSDITKGHDIAARLRVGAISINGWSAIHPSLPWGGVKESGIGRELGWNGIEACTEEKVVTIVR